MKETPFEASFTDVAFHFGMWGFVLGFGVSFWDLAFRFGM